MGRTGAGSAEAIQPLILTVEDELATRPKCNPPLGQRARVCYKSFIARRNFRRLARLRDQRAPAYAREQGMDLNYLYFRQQVSQFNADNAACDNSREAHQQMADGYSSLIAEARQPVREFRS